MNNPDLVLFVGEALVGNEAVDQLVKFNTSLADFSDESNPHLIDGIVLTKFDTIDDKVCCNFHDCACASFYFTNTFFNVCILLKIITGWGCSFNGLHHWSTHRFCWHWTNLHRPAKFGQSSCCDSVNELILRPFLYLLDVLYWRTAPLKYIFYFFVF